MYECKHSDIITCNRCDLELKELEIKDAELEILGILRDYETTLLGYDFVKKILKSPEVKQHLGTKS